MNGRFVSYFRVSTEKQGRSGLGLEAQQAAVRTYLNGGSWKVMGEYTEVESGKRSDRPKLQAALDLCGLTGATLLVAKMDRLTRDLHFLTGLQRSGAKFQAVDNPDANTLTLHILTAVAQAEREAISARTTAALAASKARGTVLGGYRGGPSPKEGLGSKAVIEAADAYAAKVGPTIQALIAEGYSLRRVAVLLTERGIQTARGGAWTAKAVSNVTARAVARVAAGAPQHAVARGFDVSQSTITRLPTTETVCG